MKKKKTFALILMACVLSLGIYCLVNKNSDNENESLTDKSTITKQKETLKHKGDKSTINVNKKASDKDVKTNNIQDKFIQKANLYTDFSSSSIPLSTISILADLPENIQNNTAKIAENNNIFMVQKYHHKLFIISDNPANIRHGIDFTEISIDNGHQTRTTLGYNDRIVDSDNDIWDYDPETHQPVRHTKYNKDGDIEFTEVWNYEPNEQIKYEMKDGNNRVISLRKETLQNNTDLRIEHLIYDKDGNTKINVSVTYDGEDVKRFTYYNSDKPAISGSVFSDYTDGLKTKETIYTSDLKPKETFTSTYKDGTREEITIFDNQNKEIKKIISDDN